MQTIAPDIDQSPGEHPAVALSEAIDALSRLFPDTRVRTVSRKLQDAGMLQLGSRSTPPMVDVPDVITMLMGLCADATLRETPEAVAKINALGRMFSGDVDPDTLPESIRDKIASAGDFLDALAQAAIDCDTPFRDTLIEFAIDGEQPELAVHYGAGVVQRFREPGAIPGHWRSHVRKSITVSGMAFADLIYGLFGAEASHG